MDAQIRQYLEELAATYPATTSAWLIGSRANGTAKPTSDWDILLFADEAVVKAIAGNDRFHRKDVDLLVVKESGQFEKPWGTLKSGSLARWQQFPASRLPMMAHPWKASWQNQRAENMLLYRGRFYPNTLEIQNNARSRIQRAPLEGQIARYEVFHSMATGLHLSAIARPPHSPLSTQ